MKDIQLFNKNCFDVFPTLEDKSINLFVLDLPYGQTACKWDSVIDLEEMWKHIKRIMKPNAILVFFCTAKFGYTLIHSNPKWFKYDLIWKKSRKVGFLSANKQPLRQHELMYVFKKEQGTYHPQKTEGKAYNKTNTGNNNKDSSAYGIIDRSSHLEGEGNRKINKGDRHPTSIIDHENIYVFDNPVNEEYNDLDRSRNKDLREYAEKVKKFINKPLKQIQKKLGNMGLSHFYSFKGSQFSLCTQKTYDFLIKEYNIDEMDEYLEYDILKDLWEDSPQKYQTYNPQKTEGKAYKCKQGQQTNLYGIEKKEKVTTENKGDRHPTSIIDHENIYVFDNTICDDIELSRNKDLREYAEKVFKFIGKTKKQIIKKIGQKIDHFFRFKSSQFGLTTKETYDELIKEYNIDEMEDYLEYDILEGLWEGNPTYNPQKTEGKPYKIKEGGKLKNNVYGNIIRKGKSDGDRHPTSIINEIPEYEGDTILVYKNPHKTIHRTQKPVELLEWLIKTYSNEGDTVMDFTMGSGTAGIGCINTKRKFIGVEMDEEIFKLAEDRIENHKKNM